MNKLWKLVILCSSCLCLAVTDSALADYIGLVHVTKSDADTVNLCNNANGANVPEPLDVCNVLAQFDDPEDRLLSVGNGDILASNGAFYQNMFNGAVIAPTCTFVDLFPDIICDTFVTIGYKCGPDPAGTDTTAVDGDFLPGEFADNGHVVGGWFNASPPNGQGDPGPDLRILVAQFSVAQGQTVSGTLDAFALIDTIIVAFPNLEFVCKGGTSPCNEACPTDVDFNGQTGAFDLAFLLGCWGPIAPDDACACLDVNGDMMIGPLDLAFLLGAWGLCI